MGKKLDDEDFSRSEKRTRGMYGLGYRLGSWVGKKENERYKRFAKEHGIEVKPHEPLKRTKSDYVFFGSFPQRIMPTDVTIQSQLSNDIYLGSDGNKYFRKFYTKEQISGYEFDKYTNYTDEVVRYSNLKRPDSKEGNYFKIEPIKWRVIHRENGILTLLSEHSLFHYDFRDLRNTFGKSFLSGSDWKSSDIRAVLNGTFLDFAFGDEREKILDTQVHNETKNLSLKEKFGSVDTVDKVYLLSVQEGKNYGLNNVDLSKHQTDFSGPYYDCIGKEPMVAYGIWLTRTPCFYYSEGVERKGGTVMVASSRGFNTTDDSYSRCGVVPVIRVKEEDVKVYSTPVAEPKLSDNSIDESQIESTEPTKQGEEKPVKVTVLKRIIYSILTPFLMFIGVVIGVAITGSGGSGNLMGMIIFAYLVFTEVVIWKTKSDSLIWGLMFIMIIVGAVCFSIGNATNLW